MPRLKNKSGNQLRQADKVRRKKLLPVLNFLSSISVPTPDTSMCSETVLSHPLKIFLLTVPRWCMFCGPFILYLSFFCYAFVRVCLLMPCGHLLGWGLASWLLFMMSNFVVIAFPSVTWVGCGA